MVGIAVFPNISVLIPSFDMTEFYLLNIYIYVDMNNDWE